MWFKIIAVGFFFFAGFGCVSKLAFFFFILGVVNRKCDASKLLMTWKHMKGLLLAKREKGQTE